MRRLLFLTVGICFCATPRTGLSQDAPRVGHVELRRYGDLLRQHGIELTEPALINALKNPDSSVRFLAAMKLAEDKIGSAIPAVEQALVAEKVPRTRVNIALALGLMGDEKGSAELRKICADTIFVPEIRLYAVRYMFDLGVRNDQNCLVAAEEIAHTIDPENFQLVADRQSALELLTRFQDLTPEESRKVFEVVTDRLDDPEPSVRIAASQALVQLANIAAIPYLQGAIAKEQDEGIRSLLEKDLNKLQAKSKP